MNLEFSRYISDKYSNIKFHENPNSGCLVLKNLVEEEGMWISVESWFGGKV